jgi:hypothetical protein
VPVGKEESSYFVIFRKDTPLQDVVKKEISTVHIACTEPE